MSEKYDGVRVFWNGDRLFTSHDRKQIYIPHQYTKALPSFAVDGELWCGAGTFDKTVGVIQGQVNWSEAQLIIFDMPMATSLPFEERMKILQYIL
jgi:DNA ligase-1